jgi:hypothetical protein
MKKLTLISALCGMLGFGALTAQAESYLFWDEDSIELDLVKGDTVFGTFDIGVGDGDAGDQPGYAAGYQNLIGASAVFTFLDSTLTSFNVVIDLGPGLFDSVSGAVLPITMGGVITGQAFIDLDLTGVLSYAVTNFGDSVVALKTARLDAEAVPDGASTVGLLGLGLVVSALMGRRLRRKSVA